MSNADAARIRPVFAANLRNARCPRRIRRCPRTSEASTGPRGDRRRRSVCSNVFAWQGWGREVAALCGVVLRCASWGVGLNRTSVTCPARPTVLHGVCVNEPVADDVAGVRPQGAQLGGTKSQEIRRERDGAGGDVRGFGREARRFLLVLEAARRDEMGASKPLLPTQGAQHSTSGQRLPEFPRRASENGQRLRELPRRLRVIRQWLPESPRRQLVIGQRLLEFRQRLPAFPRRLWVVRPSLSEFRQSLPELRQWLPQFRPRRPLIGERLPEFLRCLPEFLWCLPEFLRCLPEFLRCLPEFPQPLPPIRQPPTQLTA